MRDKAKRGEETGEVRKQLKKLSFELWKREKERESAQKDQHGEEAIERQREQDTHAENNRAGEKRARR